MIGQLCGHAEDLTRSQEGSGGPGDAGRDSGSSAFTSSCCFLISGLYSLSNVQAEMEEQLFGVMRSQGYGEEFIARLHSGWPS